MIGTVVVVGVVGFGTPTIGSTGGAGPTMIGDVGPTPIVTGGALSGTDGRAGPTSFVGEGGNGARRHQIGAGRRRSRCDGGPDGKDAESGQHAREHRQRHDPGGRSNSSVGRAGTDECGVCAASHHRRRNERTLESVRSLISRTYFTVRLDDPTVVRSCFEVPRR